MGRKRKRFVELNNLDQYIRDSFKEGIEEDSFEPNHDIFNLDIKRRKKEKKLAFKKRQNRRIKKFVEKYLYISKDGEIKKIKLIPQQVIFIADVYYQRKRNGKIANRVILWANRGGGKGVTVAVIAFLLMVYKRRSVIDMAGAADQALVVYEYVKTLLTECLPVIADKLLDGEPLQKRTRLKTGVELKCIPNSSTQTRGRHPPALIADEACQEDERNDKNVESAMNMVFSEDNPIVLLLSTFHIPIGLFQKIWDEADERGFVKYKWDIYDTAQKCTLPEKCIFCKGKNKHCIFCKGKGKIKCKECRLTRKINEFDIEGNMIGHSYEGCNGKALKSKGYLKIENLFYAHQTNDEETWHTEFECHRPSTRGPVYNLESVWDCFKRDAKIEWPNLEDKPTVTVGLDWGWVGQTSIIGPAIELRDKVVIYREKYFTKAPVIEIVRYLKQLRDEFGTFLTFADSSNPFENQTLTAEGFPLWYDRRRRDNEVGVAFNKWKDWGIGNLRKWFDKKKLIISLDGCPDLWKYLKMYKRDKEGKPIKKMDHGPDALLCAMLGHPYVEERVIVVRDDDSDDDDSDKKVLTFGGKGDGKKNKS